MYKLSNVLYEINVSRLPLHVTCSESRATRLSYHTLTTVPYTAVLIYVPILVVRKFTANKQPKYVTKHRYSNYVTKYSYYLCY